MKMSFLGFFPPKGFQKGKMEREVSGDASALSRQRRLAVSEGIHSCQFAENVFKMETAFRNTTN